MSTFPPPDGIRDDPPVAVLPPRLQPGRSKPGLHLLLLLLTALTTAGAGMMDSGRIGPGLIYASCTLLVLGSHEMGHYLACRYYRIPATLPYFIPGIPILIGTFGAVIRIRGMIPHRRALFDVAAAGPIAGFVVALPMLVAGLLGARPVEETVTEGWLLGAPILRRVLLPDGVFEVGPLYKAGWVGMLVTSLNLFPVGQLDGGHLAYAFSRRFHRLVTMVTLALMVAFVLYQAVFMPFPPAYLLWLVILLWMRDRHPRLLDETTSIGPGRRLVALLLLLIFVASFMPVPLTIL